MTTMNKPKELEVINKGDITYTYEMKDKETTPGLHVTAGDIKTDFDNVEWKELLQDYSNMRNGGAVESTTVSILKYPILRAGYTIESENEDMGKYIKWVLNNLIDSFGNKEGFSELMNHLLLALDYGCSFFEKVYSYGVRTADGKITNTIKRLAPFKPETIFEFHYDDSMTFCGIKHERRNNKGVTDFIEIPTEKIFFYAHNSEFGDPRGRSELRPARNLYKLKKDILLATARAQQRGAGIPEIKAKRSGIPDDLKKKMEEVGRTIGNMKNGYVITDDDIEVKLHSLSIQGSPEATLEFINRELFFNTLTEFMTSGIGQSGSRAATGEHKGSYELKYGVVTMSIENKMNMLIREMIDISYFGPQEVYPKFKVNDLQVSDVNSVADSLTKLYEKTILVKQDGDEEFIRSLFNMPKKIVAPIKPILTIGTKWNPDDLMDFSKRGTPMKTLAFQKVLSVDEQLSFIQKTFDVEGTENLYLELQDKAVAIVEEVVKKYILYIAKQFENGGKIEDRYQAELSNRLNKLYGIGYTAGIKDVNKEIDIASNKKFSETPITESKYTSESVKRFSGRLLFNVKTVVEDSLDTKWNPKVKSATEYVEEEFFEEGFKTDRRTLLDKVADGYSEGRAQAINENKDKIDLYLYNSILDKNLCDNCALLTGAVMTLEEAESMGFLTGKGRVNPNCAGSQSKCRCNLLVYKLKGDLI